jgi:hypothetical protein
LVRKPHRKNPLARLVAEWSNIKMGLEEYHERV